MVRTHKKFHLFTSEIITKILKQYRLSCLHHFNNNNNNFFNNNYKTLNMQ